MNELSTLRQRLRAGAEKATAAGPYTTKDFQLEVLDRLAEIEQLAESTEESWNRKVEALREQRLLKLDSRTLVAMGAIALSVTGYVIQDARSAARHDSEIESTKARVLRLEQIATSSAEARIRADVQLGELRQGQDEIKVMVQAQLEESRRKAEKKVE